MLELEKSKLESVTTKASGSDKSLDKYLGNTIKQLRLEHGLTLSAVSTQAGISRGMLSKIENGIASTSLDTLEQLANTLGVTLSRLFRDYNRPSGNPQHIKSGHGMEVVRRGTTVGHTYQLLAYDQGPIKTFEPFLISLEVASEEFPFFEHAGTEFHYMLEGKLEYRVGDEIFMMEPGDSLTFRAEVPHRPERIINLPVKFLAIIHYDSPISDDQKNGEELQDI